METLSIREAANRVGCSTKTIRSRIKAGSLRAVKRDGKYGPEYRIPMAELVRLQEQPTEYVGKGGAEQAVGVADPSQGPDQLAGVLHDLTMQLVEKSEQIGRYKAIAERAESIVQERDTLLVERAQLQERLQASEAALEVAMEQGKGRRWFGLRGRGLPVSRG